MGGGPGGLLGVVGGAGEAMVMVLETKGQHFLGGVIKDFDFTGVKSQHSDGHNLTGTFATRNHRRYDRSS